MGNRFPATLPLMAMLLSLLTFSSGCLYTHWQLRPRPKDGIVGFEEVPSEKDKAVLPEYMIEPPDVLDINGISLIPKAPYHFRAGDSVAVEVIGTLPDAPIRGLYPIGIGGLVNLGFGYGSVKLRGLTEEESEEIIRRHLLEFLRQPIVTVALGNIASTQQITGPHAVSIDGKVNLGTYGNVSVVGKTVQEAKDTIEQHLAETLDEPEVSVVLQTSNSKFYYYITQGAGQGDRVIRVPSTGNDTVLDAVAAQGGFQPTSSTKIWIARPGRNREGRCQLLRVDWRAVSQLGEPETNYQILPGDRLYVSEDKLTRLANDINRLTQPLNAISQFISISLSTASRLSGNVLGGGANRGQTFGTGTGGQPPIFVPQ